MYDPLYEIKDWYCNHYDIGIDNNCEVFDCMFVLPKSYRLLFNIHCRGYIHDPWNVDKYIDIRGEPLIRPGCSLHNLRMFRDYRECCKNKDWKTFVDKYIKLLENPVQFQPIKNTEVRDKIDDEILMKQIRNYYQLDVMTELLGKPRRKTIIDKTITCDYKFDIFNGFRFYTFKTTDGFDDDYCYGISGDPMFPFRYERDVVREQNTNRFRSIYENQPIDAELCFELYIWILRRYDTKIGLSDVPNDFYLSKF